MTHTPLLTRKRAFTLLEIMIVIFLIGLIGSVIGVNMKGSMEKGKAFKTEQSMQQITDVLTLLLEEREITPKDIEDNLLGCLQKSNLVKSPKDLVSDGWKEPFIVTVDKKQQVHVKSERYKLYRAKHKIVDDADEEAEEAAEQ